MATNVYIISGVRTAIGSFNGCFKDTPASVLGGVVINEAIHRAEVYRTDVNEVIMGQVLTAGQGQNTARQSAVAGELNVPATTINMMCGSGLKAVQLGYSQIVSGQAQVVVCGGQESMSKAQHTTFFRNVKYGDSQLKDTIICDGLTDAFLNKHMGETAEYLARKYNVSRQQQDLYAKQSQDRTQEAILSGHFKKEIVSIEINRKQGIVYEDQYPRYDTTLDKLAKLKPCFADPGTGTVTAGNASGLNDGAAALVLCSESFLKERGLRPLARIVDFAQADVKPIEMGLGPVEAVRKLLTKTGWSKDEVDLYEINEAFAVQALLVQEQLGLPSEKVNISGGAIALGHPLGMSGARILVTLLYNLHRLSLRKGIAALCIGGGMGIAIAIDIASPVAIKEEVEN